MTYAFSPGPICLPPSSALPLSLGCRWHLAFLIRNEAVCFTGEAKVSTDKPKQHWHNQSHSSHPITFVTAKHPIIHYSTFIHHYPTSEHLHPLQTSDHIHHIQYPITVLPTEHWMLLIIACKWLITFITSKTQCIKAYAYSPSTQAPSTHPSIN